MNGWLVFLLGVYAGVSAVFTAVCVRVGARTLPAAEPEPAPVAPVPFLVGCGCPPCVTAADIHAVRMLPEATS